MDGLKLYEIPRAIEELIDDETGEVLDAEKLMQLQQQFENGKELLALSYKNYLAEAEALKKEMLAFQERMHKAEYKANRAKNYLEFLCDGEKFSTDRVAVTFRRSVATEVDDGFLDWAIENGASDFFKTTYTINKAALKDALKEGMENPFARLVENQNIQIK